MAVEDRDTMLALFQAATGIEKIEDAFSTLEEVNWDLDKALAVFIPSTPSYNPPPNSSPPPLMPKVIRSEDEIGATPIHSNYYSPSYPIEVSVSYEGNSHLFHVYSSKTISDFKTEVCVRLNIPSTHLELSKWNFAVNDNMTLGDACSGTFPSLSLVAERRQDEGRVVCLLITSPNGAEEITFPVRKSVSELKQHVAGMTGIAVKDQAWSGLPPGASDLTVIRNAGFKNPMHSLAVAPSRNSSKPPVNPVPTSHQDSDLCAQSMDTQTSAQESLDGDSYYSDSEPEIELIEDDLDDTPRDSFRDSMIPEHCTDQSEALALFSENFESRYGPTHPIFFCGSMQEVINQSTKGELNDRRPVAVYLHHDKSISSNIFCQRTLCSEEIASYLSTCYLTWAWDMTMPTNTTRFLDNISLNFGEEVRNQLSVLGPSNFPLLLIFHKKPGAQLEIAAMITIDTSQSEVMSLLVAGYEQHLALIDGLRGAEEARLARERIKEEQDTAYLASEERDKKLFEERQLQQLRKVHSQEARLLIKAMEDDSRKTAERELPAEPAPGPGTATIRFRFPSGDVVNRRFQRSDEIGLLFTFSHSKGFPPDKHRILLNFPKKDLRDVPSNSTLKECGLVPQALVYVEEDFVESEQ